MSREQPIQVWNVGRKDILLRVGILRPGDSVFLSSNEYARLKGIDLLSVTPPQPAESVMVPRKKAPEPVTETPPKKKLGRKPKKKG